MGGHEGFAKGLILNLLLAPTAVSIALDLWARSFDDSFNWAATLTSQETTPLLQRWPVFTRNPCTLGQIQQSKRSALPAPCQQQTRLLLSCCSCDVGYVGPCR